MCKLHTYIYIYRSICLSLFKAENNQLWLSFFSFIVFFWSRNRKEVRGDRNEQMAAAAEATEGVVIRCITIDSWEHQIQQGNGSKKLVCYNLFNFHYLSQFFIFPPFNRFVFSPLLDFILCNMFVHFNVIAIT